MMPSRSHSTSQEDSGFHGLMMQLMKLMHMAPPKKPPEVYCFNFGGKTDVNIFSPRQGTVDVVVNLGMLDNRKSDTVLLNLLAMNRYTNDGAPPGIGVDPVTGTIVLWARQNLADLDLDRTVALLSTVLERAESVQLELRGDARHAAVGSGRSGAVDLLANRIALSR